MLSQHTNNQETHQCGLTVRMLHTRLGWVQVHVNRGSTWEEAVSTEKQSSMNRNIWKPS